MAKKRTKKTTKKSSKVAAEIMTARELSITFIVWMIGHSLLIYLANRFFPDFVVLGTHQLSAFQSIFYSMLVFTLIAVGATPLIEYFAILQKRVLKAMDWFIAYFFINAVGIWIVARFAEQLGMGISSWLVAVALAVVFDVVQGLLVSKVIR
jgi:hypothetical protein